MMNKRFIKSIAAAACAAIMASQAMAVSVSADQTYYYYYNGVYYASPYEAAEAAGNNTGAYISVSRSNIPASATLKYYDPVTNKIYNTIDAITAAGVTTYDEIYVGSYSSSAPVTNLNNNYYGYGYYSSYTGRYYSTYAAALNASNGNSAYVSYVGSNYYNTNYYGYYYSSYTGKYYSTYSAAVNASNGNSAYVTYVGDNYYNYGYNYYNYGYGYYYSTYTHKYYNNYNDAVRASNGNSSYVSYVGSLYTGVADNGSIGSIYKYYYNGVAYPSLDAAKKAGGTVGVDIYYSIYGSTGDTHYYYYYNGTYYGTIDAAKKAGGTELGKDITYVPYNYYGNAYTNFYGYNGTYYNYFDPYYNINNLFKTKTETTSDHKAEAGEPYIYGKNTKAGWKTIIKYINAASKGSVIKVDMNGCTTVDDSVLDALDGKNVSVTFVLDNGVKWTINGKDVNKAKDMLIYTEYNIDFIPKSLIKKASKDAIACSQVGISNNYDKLAAEAAVTVKFPSKRSGCTATVYRYDPNSDSLKAVDKAKVLSDGSCTFDVTTGGPYLIVLK